jgi:hypothetical protein
MKVVMGIMGVMGVNGLCEAEGERAGLLNRFRVFGEDAALDVLVIAEEAHQPALGFVVGGQAVAQDRLAFTAGAGEWVLVDRDAVARAVLRFEAEDGGCGAVSCE